MKLEKLTIEQEQLLPVIRDRWLDLLYKNNGKGVNKEATKELVKFIYGLSGLEMPAILYVDSPLSMQYAANMVKGLSLNQVRERVWAQVRTQVRDQVRNQVSNQVWDQVWDQVGTEDLKYFSTSWYGNISDYNWLSFYNYFEEIGIKVTDNFRQFSRLLVESNLYDMIQFDKLCIVCAKPSKITFEVSNRRRLLHQENGTAIEWSDGYKLYYLYGVHFDEDLYNKVTDPKITFKELMSISNMEQRFAAMKLESNREKLLESGTLLDRSDRGNELYKVEGIFRDPAYFLRYECPSTGRIYVSGIDPKVGIKGDADECQAWKFGLAIDTYKFKLTVER